MGKATTVVLLISILFCCDSVQSWGHHYGHHNHHYHGHHYNNHQNHQQDNDYVDQPEFEARQENQNVFAAVIDEGETVGRFRRQNTTRGNNGSNSCRVQDNRVLGQWRCDNGEIIDCNDLCNGRKNCADGSDETVISCRNVFCLDTAFRCSYGACIRSDFECNSFPDCADGSDERTINCPGIIGSIRSGGNCDEGFFQCKSGECVYEDGVCSGGAECKDGSDETAAVCSTHFCPEPGFRCDYGACILRMFRCDGKQDCVDGSDEKPSMCGNATAFPTSPNNNNRPVIPLQTNDRLQSTQTPIIGNNLPPSTGSAASMTDLLTSMPTVGPLSTSNDVRNIISMYRQLLFRLESQIAELRQENLQLRLNLLENGAGSTLPQLASTSRPIQFNPFDPVITESPLRRPVNSSPQTSPPQPTQPSPPGLSLNDPIPPISDAPREEGDCDAPVLQGGRVSDVYSRRYDNRFVKNGEMVVFECLAGSTLIGVNSTFCIRGQLLQELPQCTNQCSGLPLNTLSVQAECFNPNGDKIPCSPLLPPRTIAILSCKTGYKKPDRVVPDAYTCMDDGAWNAHVYKCQPICGEVTEGRRFIVGGTESNITRVPWHAGIYEMQEGKMQQMCGGTILNPTAIVTAAHCFWDQQRGQIKDAGLYAVAVGKTLRDFDAAEPTAQTYKVVSIDVYDQYRDYEGLYVSDIAVVVLEKPIIFQSYIKPICVEYNLKGNQRYVVSGIQGRVAGWGLTASGGEPSPVLKTIDLPTVDFNTCLNESPPSFRPFITTDKFCAGFTTGDSVCQGDSGGGLGFAQQTPDGKTAYFLRGIVSTGPRLEGSCDNTKYSAFTDVQLNIIFLYKYIVN